MSISFKGMSFSTPYPRKYFLLFFILVIIPDTGGQAYILSWLLSLVQEAKLIFYFLVIIPDSGGHILYFIEGSLSLVREPLFFVEGPLSLTVEGHYP
jgi:hypothetical protein